MQEVVDNKLYLGGIPAIELAKKYGTPLEVIDLDFIEQRIQRWLNAFKNANGGEMPTQFRPLYPFKDNYSLIVSEMFKNYGFGGDATSVGEIEYAVKYVRFKAEDIVFTGNNVPRKDLEAVRDYGVYPNLESERAIVTYNEIAPGAKVSVRVKPGHLGAGHDLGRNTGKWDAKFGIIWPDVPKAIEKGPNLVFEGLHTHIGTGILDHDKFIQRDRFLFDMYDLVPSARRFNVGGGIGIPYKLGFPRYHHSFDPNQKELDIEAYVKEHLKLAGELHQKLGRNNIEINHENGRWFVAPAGTLLGTITEIKDIPDADTINKLLDDAPTLTLRDLERIPILNKKNVGIDFGWENAPREVLYGQENTPHLIMPVERLDRIPSLLCDISGRICESEIDQGIDRTLPADIKPGEVIAKLNYGAYGPSSMAFGEYNMYGQMRQVTIYKGKVFETRTPQTVKDMVRNDKKPSELIKMLSGG